MGTLTIRLPDDTHERLKNLAAQQHVSINKLFEGFSAIALAAFDAESRFKARAARVTAKRGLALLDKLDRHFGGKA